MFLSPAVRRELGPNFYPYFQCMANPACAENSPVHVLAASSFVWFITASVLGEYR